MLPAPLACALLGAALAALAAAATPDVVHPSDVVLLKDGRRIEGTVLEETPERVVIQTADGRLTFPRAQVSRVEREPTPAQQFEARWKACRGAEAFYALGLWAQERQLPAEARRAMLRARRLDRRHEGAHRWLGYVLHEGRWMKPAQREELLRQAAQAELEHLVAEREAQAAAPFERAEARARALLEAAGTSARSARSADALVAGPPGSVSLAEVVTALDRGRELFDGLFDAPPGLELLGGEPAEFYLFDRDSAPYVATVEAIVAWTDTTPPGYAEVAKRIHGFQYWAPRCVSSVRLWGRPERDALGHCTHHWGHLLLNRLRFDGRLLPPWFDEGFAGLFEHRLHGRNAVFCISATQRAAHTSVASRVAERFDEKTLRRGDWEGALRRALADPAAAQLDFDKLARKTHAELTVLDVALAMAIVAWLEQVDEGALDRFHGALRASAPLPPAQVLERSAERAARYDRAFGAALGTGWREADQAWRRWFLETKR